VPGVFVFRRKGGEVSVKQRYPVKSVFTLGVFLFLIIINMLVFLVTPKKSVEFEMQ
jgi:hypothetical protein